MAFDLGFLAGISAWQASIGTVALLIVIFAAVHFTHRKSYTARIVKIKKEDEELAKYVQKFIRAHSDARRLKAHAKRSHPIHSRERPAAGNPHANKSTHNLAHKANVHLPTAKRRPSLAARLAGRLTRKKHHQHHQQKHEIEHRKEASEKHPAPKRMEARPAEKPERIEKPEVAHAKRESPKEAPSRRGERAAHSTPSVQKEDESKATGHVDRLLSVMKGPPPPARIPQHAPTSEWLKAQEARKEQREQEEQEEQETPEKEEERPLYVKPEKPAKVEPEKTQEEKQPRQQNQPAKPKQNPEAMIQDMKYELTQIRQNMEKFRKKGRNVSGLDMDADKLRRTLNLGSTLKRSSLTRVRRKLTSLHKKADKLR